AESTPEREAENVGGGGGLHAGHARAPPGGGPRGGRGAESNSYPRRPPHHASCTPCGHEKIILGGRWSEYRFCAQFAAYDTTAQSHHFGRRLCRPERRAEAKAG